MPGALLELLPIPTATRVVDVLLYSGYGDVSELSEVCGLERETALLVDALLLERGIVERYGDRQQLKAARREEIVTLRAWLQWIVCSRMSFVESVPGFRRLLSVLRKYARQPDEDIREVLSDLRHFADREQCALELQLARLQESEPREDLRDETLGGLFADALIGVVTRRYADAALAFEALLEQAVRSDSGHLEAVLKLATEGLLIRAYFEGDSAAVDEIAAGMDNLEQGDRPNPFGRPQNPLRASLPEFSQWLDDRVLGQDFSGYQSVEGA